MSGAEFVSPGTRLSAADWKATNRPSPLIDGEALGWSDWPPEPTLTRTVVARCRSRTKTSVRWFVSPGTRLVASEAKATNRPSADSAGVTLARLPWTPLVSTLTRSVAPVVRSKVKTSVASLVSPGTSAVAPLAKATVWPSALTAGDDADPPLEIRLVAFPFRSRTKTFSPPAPAPAPAPETRLAARETKATTPPSPDSDGLNEASPAGPPPVAATLASVVLFACRS